MEEIKVQNDLQNMFKKVLIFDLVIALVFAIISQWIFKSYLLMVLIGLAVAFVNLVVNGKITEYTLINKTLKYTFVAFVSFIFRITIVCGIALILFNYNKFNVIAYMLGYSLQFVSLTLYGIYIKDK